LHILYFAAMIRVMAITMRRRTAALLATATLATTVLASCSSSGGSTNHGAASTSKPSPSPTFTGSVTVGYIGNGEVVSAIGNPQPEEVSALKARVNAINAAGGINGNKLVLEPCDEKGSPNVASDCARKFVAEKVAAVVGDNSLYGAQFAPILQQAGIPRVGEWANTSPELMNPGSYPLSGGALVMMEGALLNAKQGGAKNFFVIGQSVEGSDTMLSLLKSYGSQIGLAYKGSTMIPTNAADDSPYVTAANKSGADAVLTTFGLDQTQQIVRTAVQLGSKWRLATLGDVITKDTLKAAGGTNLVTDAALASPYPPVNANNIPAVAQFNKEMDAELASGDKHAAVDTRRHVLAQWLAMYAFGQIAKTIQGPITASSVVKALDTVQNLDMQGAIPPWTPSKSNGLLARVSNPSGWFVKFDANGNESVVSPQAIDIMNAKG
jgi:branched-chain amino acid transport system substrate-binding protein